MKIVIDTSVLVDISLESRPRHPKAYRIAEYLTKQGIKAKIPMHAMFELSCALNNEIMFASSTNEVKFLKSFNEDNPFEFETVDINQEFFIKYYSQDLPYIKAGDLIFIALAKGDGAILLTEDKKQYQKSREAQVQTYKIQEFLEEYVDMDS